MKWYKWANRNQIANIKEPGIYYIVFTNKDISDNPFAYTKEIIYIGRSISKQGVIGRLNQFEKAIYGKNGLHGGAERVQFKHKRVHNFFKNVFVAVKSFPLNHKDEVEDWKQKGECVKHEYVSFAHYLERYGELPEFNDMKRSPKK